jgi:hypothetical protein
MLPRVTKTSKEVRKAIDCSLTQQTNVFAIVLAMVTLCDATEIGLFLFLVALQKVTKASKEGHRQLPHTTDRCLCFCSCLGHLGRGNRDRIISIFGCAAQDDQGK